MINAVPTPPSAPMPQPPAGTTPPTPTPVSTPTPPTAPTPTPPSPEPNKASTPPTPPTPENNPPQAPMAPVKKKSHLKTILGVFVLILVMGGAAAGFYLSQNDQDIRQQASTGNNCCSDQGWVGMGRSCGDEGAPTYEDGWNACQAQACGICVEQEQKQCDPECDTPEEQDRCIVKNGVKRWCGNDCYLRSANDSCDINSECCSIDEDATGWENIVNTGNLPSCNETSYSCNQTEVPGSIACFFGLGSADNHNDVSVGGGLEPGNNFCCPKNQVIIDGVCQQVGSCSVINQCRTYDCPQGMNYNGQECRTTSPSFMTVAGAPSGWAQCPPPPSNCGQVDYYSTAGDFDSYCGHVLYTDGCSDGTGGDGGTGGGGGSCSAINTYVYDAGATNQPLVNIIQSPPKIGQTLRLECIGTGTPKTYDINVAVTKDDGSVVNPPLTPFLGANNQVVKNQVVTQVIPGTYSMSCAVGY